MSNYFLEECKAIEKQLIDWRRSLHQIPEIGINLPKTTTYITRELDQMGIPYKLICNGSGIVALIKGKKEGKCFLLRSDTDGLPIEEEANVEFASKNNCMHACGHDIHATILLGAARLLKGVENELYGTVKLMFQPGEEIFEGAKIMVDEGVLESPSVDAGFAMHVDPSNPVGTILYGESPLSSCYGFKISITGKGGHGSQPENCIDPINVGVYIHMALQELISRECPPLAPMSLTIGEFKAGDAANIIPQVAILKGTMRVFSNDLREKMIRRLNDVVKSVANTFNATCEIEVLSDVPAVVCNKEVNEQVITYIKDISDTLEIHNKFIAMGSEDFSYISEKIPASYLALGAGWQDKSEIKGVHDPYSVFKGVHNPYTVFNEKCIALGAACYAQCAYEWLKNNN